MANPLTFPQFVDTTDSEQRWQIFSAIAGTGGVYRNVTVTNFPAIQPVSGSVTVTNFPAIQPVSGSVTVTNFPAIQPVSGSVTAQPVSGALTMSNSSVSTASALMLAASSATKTLTIQNTSANTLYVSTTNPATSVNGIVIGTGIGYQFPYIPTNALYCLGSAAGTTYTIWYA